MAPTELSSREFFRALGVLSSGRLIDLAHTLEAGMPRSPSHPEFRIALLDRHNVATQGGVSGANELIIMGGHSGTHIDALCHLAIDGMLFGGHNAIEACREGTFAIHGVDTIRPLLCRGVLADLPAAMGIEHLAPGYGISSSDLQDALATKIVNPGDAVLVRTGWSQRYHDSELYLGLRTGAPGLTAEAARYLANLHVRAVGSDTITADQVLAGKGHGEAPAHRVLLVEQGINIIEVMNLEELSRASAEDFLFIAIPLKIKGATGSPIRPMALIP